jgi:hypothetical protein
VTPDLCVGFLDSTSAGGLASFKLRHTFGAEATPRSRGAWCRSVSMSEIASSLAVSIAAMSTHNRP